MPSLPIPTFSHHPHLSILLLHSLLDHQRCFLCSLLSFISIPSPFRLDPISDSCNQAKPAAHRRTLPPPPPYPQPRPSSPHSSNPAPPYPPSRPPHPQPLLPPNHKAPPNTLTLTPAPNLNKKAYPEIKIKTGPPNPQSSSTPPISPRHSTSLSLPYPTKTRARYGATSSILGRTIPTQELMRVGVKLMWVEGEGGRRVDPRVQGIRAGRGRRRGRRGVVV